MAANSAYGRRRAETFFQIVQVANFLGFANGCRRAQRRLI